MNTPVAHHNNLIDTNNDIVTNNQTTITASPILRQKKALPLGQFKIQIIKPREPSKVDRRIIKLLSEFNEIATEVVDHQFIKFKQVETLKKIKKYAKSKLDDYDDEMSNETRDALVSIVSQYDQLVESIQVLNHLRDMSKSFRNKPQTDHTHHAVRPNDFEEILSAPILNEYVPEENNDVVEEIDQLISKKRENIEEIAQERLDDPDSWKEKWTKTRRRVWNAAVESEEFLNQKKKITFTTGAQSSMVPQATKIPTVAPEIANTPALIPSGILFEHDVPPLAGELNDGFLNRAGVNRFALSGTPLSGIVACLAYASQSSFAFNRENAISNIMNTTEIYNEQQLCKVRLQLQQILLTSTKNEDLSKLKKHIKKLEKKLNFNELDLKKNWGVNKKLVGTSIKHQIGMPLEEDTSLKRGEIVCISDNQGNHTLMMVSGLSLDGKSYICIRQQHPTLELGLYQASNIRVLNKEQTIQLRNNLNDNREPSPRISSFVKREIDKPPLSELFDTIEPIKFNKSEKKLISEPFPIIWASCNQQNIVTSSSAAINSEAHFEGIAEFGTDIPVVFTDKDHVDELQDLLDGYNVQVMSFGAAYYICGLQNAAQRHESEHIKTRTEIDVHIKDLIEKFMSNDDEKTDFNKTFYDISTDDPNRTKSFELIKK